MIMTKALGNEEIKNQKAFPYKKKKTKNVWGDTVYLSLVNIPAWQVID